MSLAKKSVTAGYVTGKSASKNVCAIFGNSIAAKDHPYTSSTGTHTGANNATVLTDSAASYTVDALIGFKIKNITDGSIGVITDNDATTITVGAGMSGGVDNDFDTDDVYRVLDAVINTNGSGSFVWMNQFLSSRFEVYGTSSDQEAGYFGYSGYTSTGLLSVVNRVAAIPCEFVFIIGLFENDIEQGVAVATSKANATSIFNTILNSGKKICLCTVFPSNLTNSATEANAFYELNRWCRELPYTWDGIYVCDVSNYAMDTAQTYPVPLTSPNATAYVSSGPHPSVYAAYHYGLLMASAFANVGENVLAFPTHYLSVANGGDGLDSAVNNGIMLGSTGTDNAPIAAGDTPTSWSSYGVSATSGSVAKTARTDCPQLEWVDFTVTGPKNSYGWLVSTAVTLSDVGLAVGDCIQLLTEVGDVTAGTDYFGYYKTELDCVGSGVTYTSSTIGSVDVTKVNTDFGGFASTFSGGVAASHKFIIPASTTSIRVRIYIISFGDAAAGDAVFVGRVGRSVIRKFD